MHRNPVLRAVAALLFAAATGIANAAVVWDEHTQGDLSGNGLAPVSLSFTPGSNVVLGETGMNPGLDEDYFRFTIASGYRLTSLAIVPEPTSSKTAFIAVQNGPQVTATAANPGALIGYSHYSGSMTGNLLPELLFGSLDALEAGTYSIWIQENSSGIAGYGFDFGVTAVPLPGAALLLLGGLGGLASLRRRVMAPV